MEDFYTWLITNSFTKPDRCWCDHLFVFDKRKECYSCGHDNPHKYHPPENIFNTYTYCDAPVETKMTGAEVKEAIINYLVNNGLV